MRLGRLLQAVDQALFRQGAQDVTADMGVVDVVAAGREAVALGQGVEVEVDEASGFCALFEGVADGGDDVADQGLVGSGLVEHVFARGGDAPDADAGQTPAAPDFQAVEVAFDQGGDRGEGVFVAADGVVEAGVGAAVDLADGEDGEGVGGGAATVFSMPMRYFVGGSWMTCQSFTPGT